MIPKFTQSDFLRLAENRLAATIRYFPESAEVQRLTFVVTDLKTKI